MCVYNTSGILNKFFDTTCNLLIIKLRIVSKKNEIAYPFYDIPCVSSNKRIVDTICMFNHIIGLIGPPFYAKNYINVGVR